MDYLQTKKPPTSAIKCPTCLDTGIVPRDGSQRRPTGAWCTWAQLIHQFKPCPICAVGEKETVLWRRIRVKEANI